MHMAIGMFRVGFVGIALSMGALAANAQDDDAEKAAREKAAAEEALKTAEAKDKVKAYQGALKAAKEPGAMIDALKELAGCKHKLVVPALAMLLRFGDEAVGSEAARCIGEVGAALPKKEQPIAVSALTPILALDRSKPAVAVAAVKALATIGCPAALPSLFKYLDSKDNAVASASCAALGVIKDVSCIDPLIKALIKVDYNPSGGGGDAYASSGGTGYGRSPGAEAQARIDAIMQPCLKSLNAITGQSFQRANEWKNWWKMNRATFRLSEPDDQSAEETDD